MVCSVENGNNNIVAIIIIIIICKRSNKLTRTAAVSMVKSFAGEFGGVDSLRSDGWVVADLQEEAA